MCPQKCRSCIKMPSICQLHRRFHNLVESCVHVRVCPYINYILMVYGSWHICVHACVRACVRMCMFCIAYWCAVFCSNLSGYPFVFFLASLQAISTVLNLQQRRLLLTPWRKCWRNTRIICQLKSRRRWLMFSVVLTCPRQRPLLTFWPRSWVVFTQVEAVSGFFVKYLKYYTKVTRIKILFKIYS